MTIEEKINVLDNINIWKVVNECLAELAEQIIIMNQDQMYEKGIMDVNNPGQTQEYTKPYAKRKKEHASYNKTEFVTLKSDGDYYAGMELEIYPVESEFLFGIISSDWKRAFMSKNKRWTPPNRFEHALGLIKDNIQLLVKMIRPVATRKIKEMMK